MNLGSLSLRGNQPILHVEPRHSIEVPDVSSDYREAPCERDRRDTSVGLTYRDPCPFELSSNIPVDFSGRSVEGQYRYVWPDTSLKLVEQFVSSGTSVGTVDHLTDRYRRCELVLDGSGCQAGDERGQRASLQDLTKRICVE